MTERAVRNLILKAVSSLGARLFRNNTGMGWAGGVRKDGRYTILKDARPLQAGLCVGSSDLIGWTPVEITQSMVGSTLACFTALEIKTGRQRPTKAQTAFLEAVRGAGGIASVVYGTEDAVAAIRAGMSLGRGEE